MGAWGTSLYANDLASDARDDFKDIFSVKSSEEATKIIIDAYSNEIDDDLNESADFWYAFADWQWNQGILQPVVKEKALNLLFQGAGLELWEEEGNKSDIKKRKEVLKKLENKLLSSPPAPKKIKNSNVHFSLKPGDIIAVKPNERFCGHIKENGIYYDVDFFDGNYIKEHLMETFGKEIVFSKNYVPLLKREKYFLMLCVRKEKYYNQKWNIPELYDETIDFVYYDFYSENLSEIEKKIGDLSFFKVIDWETQKQTLSTTDDFFGYTLKKYKRIGYKKEELKKFQEIQSQCEWNKQISFSDFLLSYELLKNPLINIPSKDVKSC